MAGQPLASLSLPESHPSIMDFGGNVEPGRPGDSSPMARALSPRGQSDLMARWKTCRRLPAPKINLLAFDELGVSAVTAVLLLMCSVCIYVRCWAPESLASKSDIDPSNLNN